MSKYSYNTTLDAGGRRALQSFKLLGSKARFKILCLLRDNRGGVCVKEIAEAIERSHSATSHQLAKLEDAGVVTSRRDGQTRCYTLTASPLTERILAILQACS